MRFRISKSTLSSAERAGAQLASMVLSSVLAAERAVAPLQQGGPINKSILDEKISIGQRNLAALREQSNRLASGSEHDARIVLKTLMERQVRLVDSAFDVVRHANQLNPTAPCQMPGCACCELGAATAAGFRVGV